MGTARNRVIIMEDRCKGCGLCTTVCPVNIVAIDKSRMNIKGFQPVGITDMEKCIGCTNCATICPDCVLTVVREFVES